MAIPAQCSSADDSVQSAESAKVLSFAKPYGEQCLTQTHQDGSKTYLHNVLETKVISWDALALSLMNEMQLNPQDGRYDKQDREFKAFKRPQILIEVFAVAAGQGRVV